MLCVVRTWMGESSCGRDWKNGKSSHQSRPMRVINIGDTDYSTDVSNVFLKAKLAVDSETPGIIDDGCQGYQIASKFTNCSVAEAA
jgi:hypothetical protein